MHKKDKPDFTDAYFEFMSDPEGLSTSEIQKELEDLGVDTVKLQERMKKMKRKMRKNA